MLHIRFDAEVQNVLQTLHPFASALWGLHVLPRLTILVSQRSRGNVVPVLIGAQEQEVHVRVLELVSSLLQLPGAGRLHRHGPALALLQDHAGMLKDPLRMTETSLTWGASSFSCATYATRDSWLSGVQSLSSTRTW